MNLPNILTVIRVAVVPVFIYLLLSPRIEYRLVALGLFLLASLSDFLDGYLARRWNQETEFGKFLDPLADKALVIGAFITFIFLSGQVQIWMVLAIIARDVLITFLRYLAIKKGESLRTSRLGKWKTAFQMFSIVVILLSVVFVSYKERRTINDLYSEAMAQGSDPFFVATENFQVFFQGGFPSILFGLSSFLPYFLMLITTVITIISGVRYLYTNIQLILPKQKT